MSKMLFAALLAADLVAARLLQLIPTAAAQTPGPAKNQTKKNKPPTPGQIAAYERLKMCGAE